MLCEEAFTGSSGRAGQRGFSLSEQGQADVCQPKMKPGTLSLTVHGLQEMTVHMTCPLLTTHLGWH